MKTFVFRGTPVSCARDVADLLSAADQDLALDKVRIGSDILVNSRIYGEIRQNWIKILPRLAAEKEVRFVGHSLGACHALVASSFTPRSVVPHVFAFAPFQCANAKFWGATYGGRPTPKTYGRVEDFAPGWDHMDKATVIAAPIVKLLGGGETETVVSWSFLNESVGAHNVDLYTQDLEKAPLEEEAHAMCRLASAVYLTDTSDVIDRAAAMKFETVDVIEAPGFRCLVLDETL